MKLLAASYHVAELQPPVVNQPVWGSRIEDDGLVLGYTRRGNFANIEAAYWSGDTGSITLLTDGSYHQSFASAVVAPGVIAGQLNWPGSDYGSPVLFSNGGITALPQPPERFGGVIVAGGGSLVGISYDPVAVTQRIAVWNQSGELIGVDASLPGILAMPLDINSHGDYVGTRQDVGVFGGFIGNGLDISILSYPETGEVAGHGINDSGTIAGIYFPDGQNRIGVVGRDGHAKVLQPLPGDVESPAFGIDNAGDIVGLSADASHNETATIYFAGSTTPVDMNTLIDPIPGVKLVRGVDINNAGQILVEGLTDHGYDFFVLTPVPEPAMLSCAAILLTIPHRVRRVRT